VAVIRERQRCSAKKRCVGTHLKAHHYQQHFKLIFISITKAKIKKCQNVSPPHYTPVIAVIRVAFVPGDSFPGGSCPRWQLSHVAVAEMELVLGGSCPGGDCRRWQLSYVSVVRVAVVFGGDCPRWQSS